MRADFLIGELKALLTRGEIVPVVGAGVSTATCNMPGWATLLEGGIKYLNDRRILDDVAEVEMIDALGEREYLRLARLIQIAFDFHEGEMGSWLKVALDDAPYKQTQPELINEVLDLPCNVVATTNFDRLLERFDANKRKSLVQSDNVFIDMHNSTGAILHLHGVYDRPSTVTLSGEDYLKLSKNQCYQATMHTLWMSKSMLFVGCSFEGLNDPDFSGLFEWSFATFGESNRRHYALVPDSQASVDNTREFLLGKCRIQLVPYGTVHADLPAFVRGINLHKEQAYEIRKSRSLELMGPSAKNLSQEVKDIIGPVPADKLLADFDKQAAQVFYSRETRAKFLQDQLKLAQIMFKKSDAFSLAISLAEAWSGRKDFEYNRDEHRVALKIASLFNVVPPSLLDRLSDYKASVPETVRCGTSQNEVVFQEEMLNMSDGESLPLKEEYARELIERMF